jgi:L-lactate permease
LSAAAAAAAPPPPPLLLLLQVPFRELLRSSLFVVLSIVSAVGPALLISLFSYEFPTLIGGQPVQSTFSRHSSSQQSSTAAIASRMK